MRRRILTLILALALITSLSACGGKPSAPVNTEAIRSDTAAETPAPEAATAPPEETAEPVKAEEPDFFDAHLAYLQTLLRKKVDITAYNWQQGAGGTIAFADIVGDETPELFYIYMSIEFLAYLGVYTYENSAAAQIMSFVPIDTLAGGGVRYCLFTTEDGKLILYKSEGDEDWSYSFTGYALDSGGELAEVSKIAHKKSPSPDYSSATHTYTRDGEEITESEYESLTSVLIDSMTSVILRDGAENEPIWGKADELDSLAMSYESAVDYLRSKVGPRTTDRPFTEEEAIAFMIPVILEDWGDYVSESSISEHAAYEITVSNKLFDGQPIYLVDCGLYRIGRSVALVFADGSTISSLDAEFSAYNDYFSEDITAR